MNHVLRASTFGVSELFVPPEEKPLVLILLKHSSTQSLNR